jgi:hypothetical protein
VTEHRGGYQDESVQGAKRQDRDQPRGGGNRWAIAGSDAWGAAHQDAAADENPSGRSGADAEKSAGRVPGVRARGEVEHWSAQLGVAAVAAGPCTQVAGRSGEQ